MLGIMLDIGGNHIYTYTQFQLLWKLQMSYISEIANNTRGRNTLRPAFKEKKHCPIRLYKDPEIFSERPRDDY